MEAPVALLVALATLIAGHRSVGAELPEARPAAASGEQPVLAMSVLVQAVI